MIHTIARTFTAGGVVEYPDGARPIYDHQGMTLVAGDGTPTNVYVSTKQRWEFTWGSPLPEIVERWRTRFAARASFSVTDPYGATWTGMIPVSPLGFDFGASYEPGSSLVRFTTYSLKLLIWRV